jgi:hypothetical protein
MRHGSLAAPLAGLFCARSGMQTAPGAWFVRDCRAQALADDMYAARLSPTLMKLTQMRSVTAEGQLVVSRHSIHL